MARILVPPPVWSDEELAAGRLRAIDAFRRARTTEPLANYTTFFRSYVLVVRQLLELTDGLTRFEDPARLVCDPAILEALRFTAGPPISDDDLLTLVEASSISRISVSRQAGLGTKIIETILVVLDTSRFPWVRERRPPTDVEVESSVIATAALLAARRVGTARRHSDKQEQEDAVAAALNAAGFSERPRTAIDSLEDAPPAGCYYRTARLGGTEADFTVRIWDRRVLAMECKVSNSSVNSIKRLNREAEGKANGWRRDFGVAQVVPAAVISGVFALTSLQRAQANGLALFWGRELDALGDWLDRTRS